MRALLQFYPGDAASAMIGSVFVQIAVIASIAWVGARLLGRRQPAARHDVWLFALLGIMATPLVTFALGHAGIAWSLLPPLPASMASADSAGYPAAEAPSPSRFDRIGPGGSSRAAVAAKPIDRAPAFAHLVASFDPGRPAVPKRIDRLRAWGGAALAVWIAGAVFHLLRLIRGMGIARALQRDARPARDPSTHRLVREIGKALGLGRRARCATHDGVAGPLTVGILRPVVIVPTRLFAKMSEERKCEVLRHELAHIVRRDPLIGLIQRFVQVILWPHPFVAIVLHGLSRTREEVCDNYALSCGDRTGYSLFLLELSTKMPGAVPGYHGLGLLPLRWRLSERVAGILDERRSVMTHSKKWKTAIVAAAFLTLTVGLGAATTVPARSAGGDEKPPKPKAERSESQRLKETLKGLERGMEALRELGLTDEVDRLEGIAAELEAEMEAAHDREAAERIREEKHEISVMATAVRALTDAGRAEEAKRLEQAMLARRVDLEERDDDEAKAIRKEAPKRKEQAALLAYAVEWLDASGSPDRAEEVAALAASMTPHDAKGKKPREEVDRKEPAAVSTGAHEKPKHEKATRDPESKERRIDDREAAVERIRQLEKKLASLLDGVDRIERELRELKGRLD